MKKAACRCLVLGVLLQLSAAAAWSADATPPKFAAFPADWLSSVQTVYPITKAPADVQWEAWMAVKAMSQSKPRQTIWIESFGGDIHVAEKLRDYFVEHHQFPAKRFKLSASQRPGWDGWVAVHLNGVTLPLRHPLQAEPSPEKPMTVSQAAPAPAAAASQYQTPPRKKGWKGNIGPELRPDVSVQWFGAERAQGDTRLRANWLGARVGFDTPLAQFPVFDTGMRGHFFHSMVAASPETRDASASLTEGELSGYLEFKANTTVFGVPMLKLIEGYAANVRTSKASWQFLGAMRGFRTGFEASTFVDGMFTLGFSGGYTFAGTGCSVMDAGGFLSQRLGSFDGLGAWDARLGMQVAVARDRSSGTLQQESWAAFQGGLVGYFY